MYAIVEIAGQQFKVAKDQKVYVHRLQGEAWQRGFVIKINTFPKQSFAAKLPI